MSNIVNTPHVLLDRNRCAHSVAGQQGCDRCVNACPEGAIFAEETGLSFRPDTCRGCGGCVAICPAEAVIPVEGALDVRALIGRVPPGRIVVFHDFDHGSALLNAVASDAGGLPPHVLTIGVSRLGALGSAVLLSALTAGSEAVYVLIGRPTRKLRSGLEPSIEAANAVAEGLGIGASRFGLIDEDDPWALATRLGACERVEPVVPMAQLPDAWGARAWMFAAVEHLRHLASRPVDWLPVPAVVGCGDVVVDRARCTLCQACARICPTGALRTADDPPRLGFVERACIQCGLCRAACPERAITLLPRLGFGTTVSEPVVLHEDAPYICERCGSPFAARSTVERMLSMLAGRLDPSSLARLKCCENCRSGA